MLRQLRERRPRRDLPIIVAESWIVDVPADLALKTRRVIDLLNVAAERTRKEMAAHR
jgi:hypothetical protein